MRGIEVSTGLHEGCVEVSTGLHEGCVEVSTWLHEACVKVSTGLQFNYIILLYFLYMIYRNMVW